MWEEGCLVDFIVILENFIQNLLKSMTWAFHQGRDSAPAEDIQM